MTTEELERKETMYWSGKSEFPDFIECSTVLGYKYVVLFQTETPNACACKDEAELMEALYDANAHDIFYMIKQVN